MAKKSNYFHVNNPNAFFDFKGGKIVLSFEQSNFPGYKSSKVLTDFVEKCVQDALHPIPAGQPGVYENFLSFDLPLSKLIDTELMGNTTSCSSRGKNLTATADRKELYEAMASEFEDMAKRLRALKYID